MNRDFSYEIIVVDDGSKDETSEVALNFTFKYGADIIRLLTLKKNEGKGGAVRKVYSICILIIIKVFIFYI
jgi:dolichyl-phosphate beta-glucosyltransferase